MPLDYKTYLAQVGLSELGFEPGPEDNLWGPKTEKAYQAFVRSKQTLLVGDGTWPFAVRKLGDDLWLDDIVITCFGGSSDPQDNGDTASGCNTKKHPSLIGVSLPMDGREQEMSAREHEVLDGSPIPRIPWMTIVEVKIGNKVLAAPIIDLGPGKQASREGEPHACDLTVAAARFFDLNATATNFKARGSVRIPYGAKYL